jgi:hypothetical protein
MSSEALMEGQAPTCIDGRTGTYLHGPYDPQNTLTLHVLRRIDGRTAPTYMVLMTLSTLLNYMSSEA